MRRFFFSSSFPIEMRSFFFSSPRQIKSFPFSSTRDNLLQITNRNSFSKNTIHMKRFFFSSPIPRYNLLQTTNRNSFFSFSFSSSSSSPSSSFSFIQRKNHHPTKRSSSSSSSSSLLCRNEEEMRQIGERVAQLISCPSSIFLHGDLGSGKTTFVRGFIQSLASEEISVCSPSYLLEIEYPFPQFSVSHLDCYRLENEEDFQILDLEKKFREAICLIEWAERIPSNLHTIADPLIVNIEVCEEQTPPDQQFSSNENKNEDDFVRRVCFEGSERWNELIQAATIPQKRTEE